MKTTFKMTTGLVIAMLLTVAGHSTALADAESQETLDTLSQQATQQITQLKTRVERLVLDTGLQDILAQADNAAAIKEWEARSTGKLDDVYRVSVLQQDILDTNYNLTPAFSYVCIDLVNTSWNSGTTSPMEVHSYGTDQQHVEFAVPLKQGDNVVGVVLATFKVSVLENILGNITGEAYAELTHDDQVLIKRGDADSRQGVPYRKEIPGGARLRIDYWPPGGNVKLEIDEEVKDWSIQVVLLLLLLVAGYFAVKFVSKHTKHRQSKKHDKELTVAEAADREARAEREARGERPAETEAEDEDEEVSSIYADDLGVEVDETVDDAASDLLARAREMSEQPAEAGSGGDLIPGGPEDAAAVPESIFRAYDIRGIVDDTLNVDTVFHIGRAFGAAAEEQQQKTVVVARDGRLSGPEIVDALIKGLKASGRHVIDIGMVPTPVLYFATQHLKTGTGIMVTGSHNPPNYNGLKMMIDNNTLSSDAIQDLRERIKTGRILKGEGTVEQEDISEEYVRYLKNDVLLFRAPKVVVDCGNGVAGAIVPRVLKELGCEVIELYCDVDGNFPNHHPDPARPENMQTLIETVRSEGAALGFAFDGDGDRLGVVDSDGNIIWPDRLLMIFARDILSRNPGAEIIYDVKCTNNLAEVIKQAGGVPVMYKTGHSFIKAKLKETGALLAGEMSGHIFIKERYFGFDDAIYSAARLLEAMVVFSEGRTTAEVFAELPDAVNTPELNVQMQEGENFAFMEKMQQAAREKFNGAKVTTIDGVRVDYSDRWGLVRSSNTTPVLVLRFEGRDETALYKIQEEFRALMLQLAPDLDLPF
jgi:phosphomannomutase/phosphoglucomutase